MSKKSAAPKVVFVGSTVAYNFEGVGVSLVAGEAWRADDPLVELRPDLFVDNIEDVPGFPRETSR